MPMVPWSLLFPVWSGEVTAIPALCPLPQLLRERLRCLTVGQVAAAVSVRKLAVVLVLG